VKKGGHVFQVAWQTLWEEGPKENPEGKKWRRRWGERGGERKRWDRKWVPRHEHIFFFFLVVLEFELWASHSQSMYSTTWATPPVCFGVIIFWRWQSHKLFARAGLKTLSSPSQPPK
jgi:hypothetical protein